MIKTILDILKRKIKKLKIKTISRKMTIGSMATKILALSIILATSPLGTMEVKAENDVIKPTQDYNGDVKINFSQNYPLYIEKKEIKSFNLVESESNRVERETREKQELELSNKKSGTSRQVIARDNRPAPADPDLGTKRALAKKAAAKYSIDWKILEAVWQVESGKAWDTSVRSSAGAGGPMQFMPSTWRGYAQDGNGNGVASMYEAEDAVFGAAQLLAQSGASWGDIDSALFSYNHAQWYVDKVKGVANSITE